ncbi:acyltransferase family protein [Deinococcus humi]|uniref:Peptidoglycan/LPS O-acetylase OafA/YrhL n=1 Tax=Deinococcus humi TaxID=662880 RepID=A0A7W8NCC8_9DEIO|nr:acyltransferase [Deinococcus humi]MBB5362039.1 peptidoglycan/LPS O-acetylase OafA/YrhL [Deinococcus humi]GGO22369.1 acyltransferase [Deinococcus humi]
MKAELRTLTGLRFMAALWVFLFHVDLRWPLDLPPFLAGVVGAGDVGVTLFFMLSGFILAYAYSDGFGGPRLERMAFWRARFARIYPLYAASLLLALPLWVAMSYPAGLQSLQQVIQVILTTMTSFGLVHTWFPSMAFMLHGGAWSLACEAFFYLCFPFLLPHLLRLSSRQLWIGLGVLWVASALAGAVLYAFPSEETWKMAYTNPVLRLPEFVAGMVFGLMFLRQPQGQDAGQKAVLCVLLAFFWLGLNGSRYSAPLHNAVLVPLIGFMIMGFARTTATQAAGRILGHPVMVSLGQASYAFYLLQLVPLEGGVLLTRQGWAHSPTTWLAMTFLCTVALAYAGHLLIEEPVRRHLQQLWRRRAAHLVYLERRNV